MAGTCAGSSFTVTVNVQPALNNNTLNPASTLVCAGSTVVITGSTPQGGNGTIYTYNWEERINNGSWNSVATSKDYTTGTLSSNNATTNGIYEYRRSVTSGFCGTPDISLIATINVQPVIANVIAGDRIVCDNISPAALTGTPTGGSGTYSYQWQISSDNVSFANVPTNGNSETYVPDPISNTTGSNIIRYFKRIVTSTGATTTSTCLTATSNSVSVTTQSALVNNAITLADPIICNGQGATLINNATLGGGNGTYAYTWQRAVGAGSFSPVSGATSATLATGTLSSNGNASETYSYKRLVTSGACTVPLESNIFVITVLPPIIDNTITADQTICLNATPAQIDGAFATGGNNTIIYSWYRSETSTSAGFNIISGETGQYSAIVSVSDTRLLSVNKEVNQYSDSYS
ncbi:MAG: hypothetical protein EOP51_29070 [Sphingobacteriales bacterium]|nr:MAG: hypothetical protein EOP51_29070 [Sphingobacteriales bacterium]